MTSGKLLILAVVMVMMVAVLAVPLKKKRALSREQQLGELEHLLKKLQTKRVMEEVKKNKDEGSEGEGHKGGEEEVTHPHPQDDDDDDDDDDDKDHKDHEEGTEHHEETSEEKEHNDDDDDDKDHKDHEEGTEHHEETSEEEEHSENKEADDAIIEAEGENLVEEIETEVDNEPPAQVLELVQVLTGIAKIMVEESYCLRPDPFMVGGEAEMSRKRAAHRRRRRRRQAEVGEGPCAGKTGHEFRMCNVDYILKKMEEVMPDWRIDEMMSALHQISYAIYTFNHRCKQGEAAEALKKRGH